MFSGTIIKSVFFLFFLDITLITDSVRYGLIARGTVKKYYILVLSSSLVFTRKRERKYVFAVLFTLQYEKQQKTER
jgi:hypothetical protein